MAQWLRRLTMVAQWTYLIACKWYRSPLAKGTRLQQQQPYSVLSFPCSSHSFHSFLHARSVRCTIAFDWPAMQTATILEWANVLRVLSGERRCEWQWVSPLLSFWFFGNALVLSHATKRRTLLHLIKTIQYCCRLCMSRQQTDHTTMIVDVYIRHAVLVAIFFSLRLVLCGCSRLTSVNRASAPLWVALRTTVLLL